MRRTDTQRLASDNGTDLFAGTSYAWEAEQPTAGNQLGDLAEGCSPHWENAWIDLGGEG
jgi:hypothetical protein